MTAIIKRKTIVRAETAAIMQGRPLIVTLNPDGFGFSLREKGRRKAFELTWHSAYLLAASKEAERIRVERKARKAVRHAN